jgi:hypothetical protein
VAKPGSNPRGGSPVFLLPPAPSSFILLLKICRRGLGGLHSISDSSRGSSPGRPGGGSATASKSGIILKLDFEKVYDKICWNFLFESLKIRVFNKKWCEWIKQVITGGQWL